ncbi:MAG TPA: lipase [Micromonosporaceae bacterium]|nr:lipase [Micromonosporaceae bacterium]
MRQWFTGLAPRRRALVLSLLAMVLAATGLATSIVLSGHPSPVRNLGGVEGPSRPNQLGTPPAGQPGPVVLVPGYGGGRGGLLRLAARIRATGRSAVVITLPGDGTGDLAAQANALQSAVARQLAAGAPSVDVIGYSAGGVVARLWMADDGGAAEVRRVISLGSPLHGADLAAVGQAFAPGACPIACQQLAPGSSLLSRLDALPLAGAGWMSIWTTDDKTVDPPDSARLAGAVNVVAQSVCPDATISHGQLPTDPLITGIVLRAIGAGPLTAPTAADCAALRDSGAG